MTPDDVTKNTKMSQVNTLNSDLTKLSCACERVVQVNQKKAKLLTDRA